jgi:hypothetical protein
MRILDFVCQCKPLGGIKSRNWLQKPGYRLVSVLGCQKHLGKIGGAILNLEASELEASLAVSEGPAEDSLGPSQLYSPGLQGAVLKEDLQLHDFTKIRRCAVPPIFPNLQTGLRDTLYQ